MNAPMTPPSPAPETDAFIARWSATSGAERSNSQTMLLELCDLLGVPRPAGPVGRTEPKSNAG